MFKNRRALTCLCRLLPSLELPIWKNPPRSASALSHMSKVQRGSVQVSEISLDLHSSKLRAEYGPAHLGNPLNRPLADD